MAVYSMTGFGQATSGGTSDTPNPSRFTVDVRSVNGRFLDLALKVPEDVRGLEGALRDLVTSHIKRGKVELRVSMGREAGPEWPSATPEALMQIARLESTVLGYFNKAQPLSVHEALQWLRQAPHAVRQDDEVVAVAREALMSLTASRAREGERLVQSLRGNAQTVRTLASQAQPLVASSVQRQQQRFLDKWNDALKAAGPDAASAVSREGAQERALTEAAAYALRIDVAEELTRLNAHLDELDALLTRGGELGKRLDFLVQELHREANTLGSKSQSLDLTNVSIGMRVAIEHMREQVQNIE
jgi:uncharacterized protein (TIGR00255 family)